MYKIEGFVETISSDGSFTIRGEDGYCLEKDGKKYNVFWKDASVDDNKSKDGHKHIEVFVCNPSSLLKTPIDGRQWEYQTLVTAKVNHQKVIVELKDDFDKNKYEPEQPLEIQKVTLK